jgi:hypothetical protein
MKGKDGMDMLVLEDEGELKFIPIMSDEEIRKVSVPAADVERIYRESKKEELELEEKHARARKSLARAR